MRKFFKQLGCERPDVFEAVCACANQQHRNSKFPQVLLTREFPIHCHECVKFFLRKGKQIAILNAGPASARYSSDFMTGQIVRESLINAFVEQQLHLDAAASMRSLASSRNAMTCSRETLGKPSRKSSIESPPSR